MAKNLSDYEISDIVADVVSSDYIGYFHSEAWRQAQAAGLENTTANFERFNRIYDDTLEAIECDNEAEIEAVWSQIAR